MGQVLLIIDDKNLKDSLNKNLIKHLGCEVLMQDSSRNAISMMGLIPDIDLIICKDVIKKDQVPVKLCEFLVDHNKEQGKDVLLLIIGEDKTEYAKATSVEAGAPWEKIVIAAGASLGITVNLTVTEKPKEEEKPAAPVVVLPSYYPIHIKFFLFLHGHVMKFDSYAKVKNKTNGIDYEIVMKAEQTLDRAFVEKLMQRGFTELYVAKAQISIAEHATHAQLMQKLKNLPTDEKEKEQLIADSFELAMDLVKNLEVSDYAKELMSLNINFLMANTIDIRALDLFLKKRKMIKLPYIYAHCMLTSLIIQNIIKNFKWLTPELKETIPYISYYHDIALQNEKFIKIHHNYFQKVGELIRPEDKKIVLNHALNAATIIEKIKDLPPDLSLLIKEHHGVKSGNNFAESLSIIVSPFTMMFIVVEDFVTRYLELSTDILPHKEREQVGLIFQEMGKKYNKLTYLEALKFTQKLIEEGSEKLAAEEAAAASAARQAKIAAAASMAAMSAAEAATKLEAEAAKAKAHALRISNVATKAASDKDALDKELAQANAILAKYTSDQTIAEQAVQVAHAAAQKALAQKAEAEQQAIHVRQSHAKAQASVQHILASLEKAKTTVLQAITEKAQADQAAWKAEEEAENARKAKLEADKLAQEKAQALSHIKKV